MRARPRFWRCIVAAGVVIPVVSLSACGSSGQGAAAQGGSTISGSSGATAGAYKVVLISDLSGAFSSVSGPGAAGAQVAVDNINANGGVNGRKIDLQVLDSQSSATQALTAARQAASGNTLAIMMFSGSAGASSITQLVQSAHIPFLSPALADTSVYPPQPDLYQPSLTAKQDAEAIEQFVKLKEGGNVSGKTIDIAAITSPYVDLIINSAKSLLTADGAKFANTARYDLPLASFATQAGTIARDKPDVVLTLGSTDDTVVVSKALTAAGVSALQIGIPSGAGQDTIQQIKSPNYFALTADPYPSELPDFLSVAAKYGKKSDVSGSIFSMSGWVAAYMLSDALSRCSGTCTSAALNTALESVSNYTVPDGVSYGPVSFSPTDHVAAGVVRFRGYDPTTGKFSSSAPITVS